MSYDIAVKIVIEHCRGELLRRFLGIDVTESTLLEEAPQETATVRRSDFPLLVTDTQGARRLVLIEAQSRWEGNLALRLLEYRCRHMLHEHVASATTCILLLTASKAASDLYEDDEVAFRYHLLKVYEWDAITIIDEGAVCMLPLTPLMRGGEAIVDQADRLLYESDLPRQVKADMAASMTILAGLVSEELAAHLLARRRDIMVESYAYEMIKQEGLAEGRAEGLEQGLQQGLEQGLEQGRQQGLEQGRREGARNALLDAIAFGLDLRFGAEGLRLLPEISNIEDVGLLRAVFEHVKTTSNLADLRRVYQSA